MTITIGCYHTHHSNIDYIERALGAYDVQRVHFVDPGLDRQKTDASFTAEQGQRKIAETLYWIASCRVDAILVTCTYFTANITEELEASLNVPLIKIDDPMLGLICGDSQPQLLVFTNPATVQGTMDRVNQFAERKQKEPKIQPLLLEGTFELLMQGNKGAYIDKVSAGLAQLAAEYREHRIWAVQLSMFPAAERAASASGMAIANPLDALTQEVVARLQLKPLA